MSTKNVKSRDVVVIMRGKLDPVMYPDSLLKRILKRIIKLFRK